MLKTYQGQLNIADYGDSDDVLFISSCDDPLAMELEWITGKNVTVRYWVTEIESTKEEAKEDFIRTLCGNAKSRFRAIYSEYTGYLWTDEELNVGGHDIISELSNYDGEWLILEIEFDE